MPGPVEAAILADLAPAFRVRRVQAAGGTLRVIEGGEGPPLVLVHGRGSAATTWFPLLSGLAAKHRVLAVDLPGFGETEGYRFAGGGVEAALAYFVEPLEAWLAAEKLDAPVLVGHSLGGLVAIEIALRRRVAIRALVLVAPMGVGPEVSMLGRLFFHAGPERVARVLGRAWFTRLMGEPGSRGAELAFELHAVAGGRPDADAAFLTMLPLVGAALHRRERLREIEVPALVVGGERDEIFPAPLAIAAAAAMPKGEVVLLPHGHSPHTDDPARVVALVEQLLG
jgi:pimeloyl-ACP methyl ester carboxylesterase